MDPTLKELLAELRGQGNGGFEEILKTISTQSVGYTTTQYQPFNLDPVGKLLLPELTPLQNMGAYSVETGEQGDSFEYRAIVAKNTAKHGGAAINTGSVASTTDTGRSPVVDYSYLTRKKFRQKLAPEAAITWELYRSSGAFNALGKVTIGSLITAKEIEERRMLGDSTTALGTPGTPSGTPSNSGGTLTNANSPYTIAVIALNYHGWWYWGADGNPSADLAAITTYGLPSGAVQGSSITSAASSAITIASGSTGSIAATVAEKKGAFAYLWLIEHTGTYTLAAVSTVPHVTITTQSALTVATTTTDGSTYDLDGFPIVWDGFFAQIVHDADVPGEYTSLNGNTTPGAFTTTGSGSGVQELEAQFAAIARKWYLSPEIAIMSPATLAALSNVAIGSSAPAYRLNIDAGGNGNIISGSVLAGIHNQYMKKVVTPIAHPLFPDGKIILYTKTIPYPNAGVGVNMQLHCTDHFLQDFYARITDVAPPGPWAIKTYGAPAMIWPRPCGVVDGINVAF